MAVLIGTRDGVYRTATVPVEEAEQVLNSGDTPRVRTFPEIDGVFAATKTGLHRSMDEGQTWEDLGVPQEEVYSIVASPDGERLYAGTHPAHLYVRPIAARRGTNSRAFRNFRRGTSGIRRATATKPTCGVLACTRRRPTA